MTAADIKDAERKQLKAISWPDMDADGLPSSYVLKVLGTMGKWSLRMSNLCKELQEFGREKNVQEHLGSAYTHIYVYVHTHAYIHICNIYMHVDMSDSFYKCACIYRHICIYVYISHLFFKVHVYIYVYMYIYKCVYIYVYIYTYIHIYTHLCYFVCMYVYTYIHAFGYVFMCTCTYRYMCTCMYVNF